MDSLDCNVFVLTKSRVDNCTTIINANSFKLNIVVEPAEYIKYENKYPHHNFIILPENDRGVSYVRNYIKKITEEKNMKFYWQLDDDISNIFVREGKKLIKAYYDNLFQAAEQFMINDVALGSLEYRQFAWSASKDLILNSFCDSCVFVDNEKTFGLRYDDYVEGKEDRDFAMQVIRNGCKTGRTTKFAFSAPANGSNKGGLKEIFYDIGKEEISVNRMIEKWGHNICQRITKDNGRVDVKINWKNINNKFLF